MSHIFRIIVATFGLCGAGTILYNKLKSEKTSPEDHKELVRLAAVALSSEVIDTVLIRDENSQKLLKEFIKNVFLHPDVVNDIKQYAISEFTTNQTTITALRKFIVEDIICDTWVADELISMVKETGKEIIEDRTIHPTLSMRLISSAAIEGLQSNNFKEALKTALRHSFWLSFLGPPPENIRKYKV